LLRCMESGAVQILWASGQEIASIGAEVNPAMEPPMRQQRKSNHLSRTLTGRRH